MTASVLTTTRGDALTGATGDLVTFVLHQSRPASLQSARGLELRQITEARLYVVHHSPDYCSFAILRTPANASILYLFNPWCTFYATHAGTRVTFVLRYE